MRRNKREYFVRFEKSLCTSLLFFIMIFAVSKHHDNLNNSDLSLNDKIEIVVEELPPITQKKKTVEAPKLPSVPIPSEDEFIPQDETIEDTNFKETDDIPAHSVSGDFLKIPDNAVVIKKKTEHIVKSGYIKLRVFINKFGQVDSVKVVENTSRSKEFEKLAILSAFSTRYIKRSQFKKKSKWIERIFYFGS